MRHPTRQRLRLSGGTELSFIMAGKAAKPAVLLLHGSPSSARMFREVIPELSQAAQVIAPDLPGFGESDVLPSPSFPAWRGIARWPRAVACSSNLTMSTRRSRRFSQYSICSPTATWSRSPRRAKHRRHHRRAAGLNPAEDLEAVALIQRDVTRVGGLEVGR